MSGWTATTQRPRKGREEWRGVWIRTDSRERFKCAHLHTVRAEALECAIRHAVSQSEG